MNDEGLPVRCGCLSRSIRKRKHGDLYTEEIVSSTPLSKVGSKNLMISGYIEDVRKHLGRLLTSYDEDPSKSYHILHLSRLVEIYLQQDEEFSYFNRLLASDLLVLFMGFYEKRNSYLPELINEVVARRSLSRKPVWVVLGQDKSFIQRKYGDEVAKNLLKFKEVIIQ